MSSKSYAQLIHRPFKRVLIANRGEIALRVIRACRDLDIIPLAVYSEADLHSRHVALADAAYEIGAGPSSESYLRIDKIIEAAKALKAEAVHPGYGFLSENAEFADAVLKAGMVWIGPSPHAIHAMGDKTFAKRTVQAAGVPCSPGKNEPLKDVYELQQIAREVGYPLILKAAAGGGGRGMRVVRKDEELAPFFEACSREAQSYFNNPDVFCERYIEHPRHVEFQILADSHGNTIHLYERDCTVQRRHQKLMEEAPSSYLSDDIRQKMGELAVKAAQSVGYVNAGTVEFILESPTQFYFMEMNTRIQVEHPVTELVTGIDLLQMQLRVAMGEKLNIKQGDVKLRGWAFEARINTEDAYNGFRPNPGRIQQVEFPAGPGVRVDSHIYNGYTVPEFYDSMVAKLLVHGSDRSDALKKMRRALSEFTLTGVESTIPFHQALVENKAFQEGVYTTRFLEENEDLLKLAEDTREAPAEPLALAAAVLHQTQSQNTGFQESASLKSNSDVSRWSTAHIFESTRR